MKSFLALLPLLLVSMSSLAGIEVRNGGGGWVSDGQYMTFYSAKIPVQRKPLEASKIPGMNYLVKKMLGLKTVEGVKTQILKTIFPVSDRPYYAVDATQFNESLKKDLRSKYAHLMHISEENVAVFATTDPVSHETFLLPEFYKLREPEQAAILFHESLWVLDPNLDYTKIVAAEEAAQAYFESDTESEHVHAFYYQLSLLLFDRTVPLNAALQFDRDHHILPLQPNTKNLSLKNVFGVDFITCIANSEDYNNRNPIMPESQGPCAQMLFNKVITLSMKNPSSVFYKALLDFLKQGGLISFHSKPSYKDANFGDDANTIALATEAEAPFAASFPIVNSSGDTLGTLNFH